MRTRFFISKKGVSGKKNTEHSVDSRIDILFIFALCFVLIIVSRLFYIQIIEHSFYETLAIGQREISKKLLPVRGEIFAEDYSSGKIFPIATNQEQWFIYAVPKDIEDLDMVVEKLSTLLGIDPSTLKSKLDKASDPYEPLAHGIDDYKKEKIESFGIKGISFMSESARLYPMKEYASHITGFVGYSNDKRVGQYGIEGEFEKILAGTQGKLISEQDAGGRWIMIGRRSLQEAKNGESIVLTIDSTLQNTACKKLFDSVQRHGADKGSIIIMNPKTGAILSLCNYPTFDPNIYNEVSDLSDYNNLAVSGQYEPGSVFKAFTMASALDLGKVTPNTTYKDTGSVSVAGYTIKNSDEKANGIQTMTQVLENSLNTGSIFAVKQVGNQAFYEYVQKFGFGELSGIDLPSEPRGNISSLESGKDVYAYTASYGQGITVTPIQLITGYAAIANGGKLMKPYIIKEIRKPNGAVKVTEPQIRRQVISESTALTLGAMLVSVVKNGHPKRAGVKQYFIAGKTGTAQVPDASGGYATGKHKDTFIGFGPINDPQFIMLAKMDNPKDVPWADSSVAPLFGEIAEYLLHYYQIPPDDTEKK